MFYKTFEVTYFKWKTTLKVYLTNHRNWATPQVEIFMQKKKYGIAVLFFLIVKVGLS